MNIFEYTTQKQLEFERNNLVDCVTADLYFMRENPEYEIRILEDTIGQMQARLALIKERERRG